MSNSTSAVRQLLAAGGIDATITESALDNNPVVGYTCTSNGRVVTTFGLRVQTGAEEYASVIFIDPARADGYLLDAELAIEDAVKLDDASVRVPASTVSVAEGLLVYVDSGRSTDIDLLSSSVARAGNQADLARIHEDVRTSLELIAGGQ